MQYVLAVKGEVYGSQAAYLAYQFAEQLLASGHEIRQIFFFQNGVSNANMLVISYIGYKKQKVHVSSLLHSDNNVIVLETYDIAGEVVIASPNYDDVYGHRTYKPKSHKEKNKKKCK